MAGAPGLYGTSLICQSWGVTGSHVWSGLLSLGRAAETAVKQKQKTISKSRRIFISLSKEIQVVRIVQIYSTTSASLTAPRLWHISNSRKRRGSDGPVVLRGHRESQDGRSSHK